MTKRKLANSRRCCKLVAAPSGLDIDFSFNQIGTNGIISIAKALQSPNCPKDLSLTFYDNGLCDKGYAALANALENNLSVTVQGVMRANTRLDAYNCRNNFIRQYPQHENFIKKMCYERGFYKASPECQQTPASLKSLAGRRLLLNTNRDTLEEQRKFPQEIHEFLKELDAISDTLTSTPQPIM